MRARLIVNPQAGRGEGRRLGPQIGRFLADHGLACITSFSTAPGEIAAQAETACQAGVERLIVAGGDGSVNEAVNGILRAGRDTKFGVVPIGTGNDFIKAAGIPADWRAACEHILADTVRPIDVGICNGHYFANGVGAGFDAEVAQASRGIPLLRGNAVYCAALLKTLARGVKTPHVTIEDDHGRIEDDVTLIEVANGHYCGGAFHIAPGAVIDDGWFDVVVAQAVGRLGILRFAPRVLAGTHLSLPIVRHHRAKRVTIVSSEGMCVHADGEIIDVDARRLEIELLPKRLRLLCQAQPLGPQREPR